MATINVLSQETFTSNFPKKHNDMTDLLAESNNTSTGTNFITSNKLSQFLYLLVAEVCVIK